MQVVKNDLESADMKSSYLRLYINSTAQTAFKTFTAAQTKKTALTQLMLTGAKLIQ